MRGWGSRLPGGLGHPEEGEVVESTDGAAPLRPEVLRADVLGMAVGSAARVDRLETIFELAPVGIGIVDLEGHTTMTNEVLRRLLGYSAEEFATMSFAEFTHPDDVQANLVLFARLVEGAIDNFELEKRFIRKDGGTLWAHLTVSLVRDAGGNPDYAIGMTQDISDRKRLESDLHRAEERYRLLVERVPAVVYVAEPGAAGRWQYVSPQIQAMLGFSAQEWMADPDLWLKQLHPEDQEEVLADEELGVLAAGLEGKGHSSTYRLYHRNGATVWVRDDAMMLCDQEGVVAWHGVLVDVTPEKRLEARLEHQAFHDALTGLPNRKLFHDRASHALDQREPSQVAVLFIDLDHFKTVNDSFGHASGDQVIVAAARRLQSCARVGDTAARVGGDEFALLVEGMTAEQLTALADRVIAALSTTPVEFSGRTLTIGASVGIAVAGPGETTETLLRNADLAMYEAKFQGGSRHVHYEPTMHATLVERFRLEDALQSALANGAMALAYQPIVDLRNGVVAGFEALTRWSDCSLGEVPPSQFIPVAERTGLIHQLGRWAIEQACRELAQWRSARGGEAYVSVNVSPLELDNDQFASSVVRILLKHGLEPSALVLEVTEGALLVEAGRQSLGELRSHGVRVAIDDFGTGYSSLSYLRQLPVDMVKIDQTFLRPLGDNSSGPAFLRAIIRLAETLNLATICEGIETPGQLADLQAVGCGFGQGYLLARPGPLAEIPATISVTTRVPV